MRSRWSLVVSGIALAVAVTALVVALRHRPAGHVTTPTTTTTTAGIALPDVVGQANTQAMGVLAGTGLHGMVITQSSSTVPKDQVIAEDPAAGSRVTPGTTVTVIVSTGPPPPIPVRPASNVPTCTASSLRVHGGREGDHTGAHGDVYFANVGSAACVLAGSPNRVELLRGDGSRLGVSESFLQSYSPPAVLNPDGSDEASVVVYWFNWCGPPPGPLNVRITFPHEAGSLMGQFNGPPSYDYVPACVSANQLSTLQIGPFMAH